jgi:signal transduction histidine kinase
MITAQLKSWLIKYRHGIFLAGLITFFFLPEITQRVFNWEIRFPVLVMILTVCSIPVIGKIKGNKVLLGVIIFLVVGLSGFWAKYQQTKELAYASIVFLFIYFSFIAYYLFADVFKAKKVSLPIVTGSFSGYFLIGVLFSLLFSITDVAYPDTLNIDNMSVDGLEKTFYYSFITLTTVGYGDYLPTSSLGQKLAILEALIGQFYIAAVIATIVGKFIAQDSAKQVSAEKRRLNSGK